MGELADAGAAATDCAPALTPARRLWLERLDHNATPLLEHLSQAPSHRLGVYFERLWHFFLHQNPDTELVAHNLPVHQDGRTAGEFDCLYYCRRRMRYVHLELAVKYYLAAPGKERPDRPWLGPDTRERLDVKLTQLLERQIRLSEAPAAGPLLAGLGVESPLREIALKGYLFQPLAGALPPPGYNNENPMNDWLRPGDLADYCATNKLDSFHLLQKMQWLSRAQVHEAGSLDREQLHTAIGTHDYPLLVASLDDLGTECRRFFVVPEQWPDAKG
jgi:hypothetical protein